MASEGRPTRVTTPTVPDPHKLAGLLDLLAHAPTPHELLRSLIHSSMYSPAPRAGALGVISDDAELVELASYGLTRGHGFTQRQSVWHEIPPFIDFRHITPVRRDVQELGMVLRSAGIALDPEPWARSVLIQAVHARRSTPVGALMLLFDVDVTEPIHESVRNTDLHAALLVAFRSEPFRAAQREVAAHHHGRGPFLTDREVACLRLAARGRTNKEIAARIRMSPSTVKATLTGIYTKLEVARRRDAVDTARHLGLI